jgi:hypothetical protein
LSVTVDAPQGPHAALYIPCTTPCIEASPPRLDATREFLSDCDRERRRMVSFSCRPSDPAPTRIQAGSKPDPSPIQAGSNSNLMADRYAPLPSVSCNLCPNLCSPLTRHTPTPASRVMMTTVRQRVNAVPAVRPTRSAAPPRAAFPGPAGSDPGRRWLQARGSARWRRSAWGRQPGEKGESVDHVPYIFVSA